MVVKMKKKLVWIYNFIYRIFRLITEKMFLWKEYCQI